MMTMPTRKAILENHDVESQPFLYKIDNNYLIPCETDFNIGIGHKVYNHFSIRACDPIRVGNSEVIKISFATKSS